MGLAGITTGILMHSNAIGEPIFRLLAGIAYLSSLILVVSGIYAVNVIPPRRRGPSRPPAPAQPRTRPKQPPREPLEESEAGSEPPSQTRLGDLLVQEWGLLTPQQLSRAAAEQQASGESLLHVLASLGLLTDEDLERVLEVKSAAMDPWHDAPRRD